MAATRYCPRCGIERREGERFCRNCGAALGTGETTLTPTPAGLGSAGSDPDAVRSGGEPTTPLEPRPARGAPEVASLPAPPPAPAEAVATTGPIPPRSAPAPAGGLAVKPFATVGGLALIVSAILPWLSSGDASSNAFDLPLEVLWTLEPGDGPVKLGFAPLVLGALGGALAFLHGTKTIRRLCGVLALAVVLAFAVQLYRAIDAGGGTFADLLDLVGAGVYVALAGAIALTASR